MSIHEGEHGLSSSILIPTGKKPRPRKDDDEEGIDYAHRYEEWSCRYSPGKAWDKNPKTAWVEGAKGHGIGEILLLSIDVSKKIKIWTGYGKSKKLYKANSRPKKLRVAIIEAEPEGPSQAST